MKTSLRKHYHDAALEAGGSFYPDVLGDTGNKFADILVQHCAKLAADSGNMRGSDAILRHFDLPIHCNICDQEYTASCEYQQGRCPHHPALISWDNNPKRRFLNLYNFLTGKE